MLHKLNIIFHQLLYWLYNDSEKVFGTGGFVGAGVTATFVNLNYLYWAKVIVSAVIGGLVNIGLKKLVDSLKKREDKNEHR
jgi:hypothetical protein